MSKTKQWEEPLTPDEKAIIEGVVERCAEELGEELHNIEPDWDLIERDRAVIERLRREDDNTFYASRCRSCGVTWKVYQKFPGHNPDCEEKTRIAFEKWWPSLGIQSSPVVKNACFKAWVAAKSQNDQM
jgi:hypothetical protein